LSPLLRTWYNQWGATPEEVLQTLPGDELVPTALMGYTRAITIQAPADRVWSWLAQIGQGRGGLYSYRCKGTSRGKMNLESSMKESF
jgi:hypothetical protein